MKSNIISYDVIESKSRQIVKMLIEKGLTISTAESCTGGMLSACITSVSGSSGIFEYGVCSYSERIKMQELSVKKETLEKFTVVSDEVAREMATGVMKKSGADIGVGITGIAGPTGFTEDKPVGTVYVAVKYGDRFISGNLSLYKEYKNLTRDEVRSLATFKALEMVEEIISH